MAPEEKRVRMIAEALAEFLWRPGMPDLSDFDDERAGETEVARRYRHGHEVYVWYAPFRAPAPPERMRRRLSEMIRWGVQNEAFYGALEAEVFGPRDPDWGTFEWMEEPVLSRSEDQAMLWVVPETPSFVKGQIPDLRLRIVPSAAETRLADCRSIKKAAVEAASVAEVLLESERYWEAAVKGFAGAFRRQDWWPRRKD